MTERSTVTRPTLADPIPWAFPHFELTSITAGLDLFHRHLPGQRLVALELLLDAPITCEDPGLEGVATITARSLDEGSQRRDSDAFAAALDRAGASFSARASLGGTQISMQAPADRLDAALGLLAEGVLLPVFPDRDVNRIVRQRLDQIRRQLAEPEYRARYVARSHLVAPSHRASQPTGGTPDTVGTITRDDVVAFHAERAVTGRARLVVAGDLSKCDLPRLVATAFDEWSEPVRDPYEPTWVPVMAGPRTVVVDQPGAVQTQLVVGRAGIDRRDRGLVSLQVAAHVLGGTLTSRLDRTLREERGYTYGIRTRLIPMRRGGLIHLAAGSVHTEVTGPAVVELLTIATELAADGVRLEEHNVAVDYLAGVQPLRYETAQAVASTVASNLAADLPPDHTATELERLRRVTVDETSEAAATHLPTDDLVIVAVGDADHIAEALRAVGHGSFEVVDQGAP